MDTQRINTTNPVSPNMDSGDPLSRNNSRLKFEVVSYNPFEPQKPKGSFLGKVMSALGFMSAPLAFMGPPGILAAMGGQGLGAIGRSMDAKASTNQMMANQAQGNPGPVGYPGYSSMGAPTSPAMETLVSARDNALYSSSQTIRR